MSKQIEIKCTSDTYLTFADMVPFEDNPRELSDMGFAKLKRSILELGIFKPFLIWKKGNKVLGGNQRYRVLTHLVEEEGYKVDKLPVTILDVPEGIAKVIVLRDNQSDGDWAYEMLAPFLADIEKHGVDKTLSGFTDREMVDLVKLSSTPDEQRKQLEEMAEDSDIEDMVTKQFGVSFKVPDEYWDWFKKSLKVIEKETGSDDVWTNIRTLMAARFPLPDDLDAKEVPLEDEEEDEEIAEPKPKKKSKSKESELQ